MARLSLQTARVNNGPRAEDLPRLTNPPRRQSFSQLLALRGVDQNYLAQGALRTPHSQSPAQVPRVRTRTVSTESGTGSRLRQKRQGNVSWWFTASATTSGRSLLTDLRDRRHARVGWSYRSAAAVVISRLCGGPTLTGCQGRKRQ
jgi:hypothetical protein